jgi:regulator of sirC expression with transglutaminase-like and TPR domain
LNTSEIRSLLFLLDDTDSEVVDLVEKKLLSYGINVLPLIVGELTDINDKNVIDLTAEVVNKINYQHLLVEFKEWYDLPEKDLLHGVYLISKFKYPMLEKSFLIERIEKIKFNAWLDMRHDITAEEKVKILNDTFYDLHKFSGNVEDYKSSSNSFINEVLETKKGNPIMLCIIYMLVAQQLNLPVFGINLPQHFMLAFLEEDRLDLKNFDFKSDKKLNAENRQVLFYINVFHKGGIYTQKSLEQFIEQIKIPANVLYYLPCDNLTIVKRVLRNLAASYKHEEEIVKFNQVLEILYLLGEPPLAHFSENTDANFDE